MKKKLVRITTVPISLRLLLKKQLDFMRHHYDVTAVSTPGPDLQKAAEEQHVPVAGIEMSRKITPIKDLKAVMKLYLLLRKIKPEIVHTHTPKAGVVGMMAAWLAGVPIRIHTVAGLPLLEATGLKRRILNMVEKITYAFAQKVYPNSFQLKDIIVAQKLCKPEKLKVIGNGSTNGIDTAYFNPDHFTNIENTRLRTELGIEEEDIVFCFIGRVVRDKGGVELINAFLALYDNSKSVKLLLVGPFEADLDPLPAEIQGQIETHEAILYLGYKDDVRPYLAISNIFVFPSYREGFPNVVLQAGAMSLPAIVSDINGCNEIIQNGRNGLIVPVKDTEALKKAMTQLLSDKGLLLRMSEVARKTITDSYEQQFVWNELLKEYKLLEQKYL